jgi:periplasmic divalent cation tolerance protein
MPDPVVIALSTCPDEGVARQIAQALVTEGLAACVNRVPGVVSTYSWDGALQEDGEILLIIKTTAGRIGQLEARLKALHPYEVPELVAVPATGGNERYLEWVRQGVARRQR